MKLKNLFFVWLIQFSFYQPCLSQHSGGCLVYNDKMKPTPSFEQVRDFVLNRTNLRLDGQVTLPVQLHFVVNSLGKSQDLNEVKSQFLELNSKFLPTGIQFAICNTVNYIQNPKYDTLHSLLQHFEMTERYNSPSTIDLFYVTYIEGAAGLYSSFTNSDGIIVVRNNIGATKTLIHEFGHYFGLAHTHDILLGREFVNGTNCSYAGDKICDTPADPNLVGVSLPNCTYSGNVTDPNGQLYKPDVTNYMSYANSTCIHSFTQGQYDLMSYVYQNDYANKYNYVCATKPDFLVSIDPKLNKLDKGINNTLKLVFFNFSSAAFSSAKVNYTLNLVDVFNNTTQITTGIIPKNVGPFYSDTSTISVFVPSSLPDGAYSLSLVVDPDNSIPEISEANNTAIRRVAIFASGKALPDLEMKSEGAEFTYAGYEYLVRTSVKNIGNFDSDQASYRTYISKDAIISPDDIIDGPSYYSSLTPNEVRVYDSHVLLTDSIDETFYIIKILDQEDDILESNENNNVSILKVTTIAPPANLLKPDYTLSKVDFTAGSSTLERGARTVLTASIDNIGDTTTFSVSLGTYFSLDNVLDASDVKTAQSIENVFNSASRQIPFFSASVPANAPLGKAFIIVVVDNLHQLVENNENNNTFLVPVTVIDNKSPHLDIINYTLSTNLWYYNSSWQFDATIKNTGLAATKAQMVNFYLTTDKLFDYLSNTGKFLGTTGRDVTPISTNAIKNYTFSKPILATEINPGSYYLTVCADYSPQTVPYGNATCIMLPDKVTVGYKLTGIDEGNLESQISILYPNPATDVLNIRSSSSLQMIEIHSQEGLLIKKYLMAKSSEGLFELSISDIQKGVYVIKLYGEGQTQVHKLVIL